MPTCPSGHDTASSDYCDVCGLPVPDTSAPATAASAAPAGPPAPGPPAPDDADDAAPAAADGTCPHCGAGNPADALFCEACGYDFTTGTPPRPLAPPDPLAPSDPSPAPAPAPAPSAPAPAVPAPSSAASATPGDLAPPLADGWVVEVWIDPDWYVAQASDDPLPSAGVPAVVRLRSSSALVGRASRSRQITPDVDLATDNGISRRHCQLTTDGSRWFVEDLGSSNGTFLGSTVKQLPTTPIPPGERREIGPDDSVYLGAWTRLVIRRAQPGEA